LNYVTVVEVKHVWWKLHVDQVSVLWCKASSCKYWWCRFSH